MAKRMLIDATHPEETRVVVVSGKRLEEFDFETASKKQLKGNIYLAKVTRVEPSLQAAFVDYGGNRHGFLAFSEIHPDYYRIPVADRQALLAEEAAAEREAEAEDGESAAGRPVAESMPEPSEDPASGDAPAESDNPAPAAMSDPGDSQPPDAEATDVDPDPHGRGAERDWSTEPAAPADDAEAMPLRASPAPSLASEALGEEADERPSAVASDVVEVAAPDAATADSETAVETVGGDEDEMEEEGRPRRPRVVRHYKIQEVIKRRQIMLVQVTKEERGNKGAALTTYLSLAGRYCVLMPNTARGGGVSRKITSPGDRKRLKSIIEELDIPEGMAVIVRTAGSERSKAEIRRDYEYLLRMWDEIRDLTLKSTAPALIYEEASLIKRSIRDLYTRDIDDIVVEGEEGYKAAKSFMRMLTPSHAKRVQAYRDSTIPLFHRYQVESQIDAIHNPVVQLKSGGYIVLNSTEALVAIDVNSGRSTRERNIEETALRTNLESADEIARQLRLRDLAGLIVIDFIDMEENRHNAAVERRLKEAMRHDRARIQLGRISHFGLLELSRQRLRPSLFEASTQVCRYCRGIGHVRSTESAALHVLRSIEEDGIRNPGTALTVAVPTTVALYILNQKRKALAEIEQRHTLNVLLSGDDALVPPDFRLERVRALAAPEARPPVSQASVSEEEPEIVEEVEEAPAEVQPAAAEEPAGGRRRSRRRRRRRDDGREPVAAERGRARAQPGEAAPQPEPAGDGGTQDEPPEVATGAAEQDSVGSEEGRRRRRRGKRGGRRRRRGDRPVEGEGETPRVIGPGHEFQRLAPLTFEEPEDSEPAAPEPKRAERPDPDDKPWHEAAGRTQDAGPDQRLAHARPQEIGPELHEGGFPAQERRRRHRHGTRAPQHEESQGSTNGSGSGHAPAPGERPAGAPRRGWWKRLVE